VESLLIFNCGLVVEQVILKGSNDPGADLSIMIHQSIQFCIDCSRKA